MQDQGDMQYKAYSDGYPERKTPQLASDTNECAEYGQGQYNRPSPAGPVMVDDQRENHS